MEAEIRVVLPQAKGHLEPREARQGKILLAPQVLLFLAINLSWSWEKLRHPSETSRPALPHNRGTWHQVLALCRLVTTPR